MSSVPVTVVVPAFNREELLARSLASISRQTMAPAEVIVVDDASADDTAAVAERWGARVIRHEQNRGEGGARNTAVTAATSDWVALLDSDDRWLPGHLERLWAARAGHVLVGASALTHGDGRPPRLFGHASRTAVVLDDPSALVFPENFVAASGVMLHRETAVAAGLFRPLPFAADLDMWIRMLRLGSGVMLPEPGYWYELHPGQVTTDKTELWRSRVALWAEQPEAAGSRQLRRLDVVAVWDAGGGVPAGKRLARFARDTRRERLPPEALPLLLAWRLRKRLRTPTAVALADGEERRRGTGAGAG